MSPDPGDAALLAQVPDDERQYHGVPHPAEAEARERAMAVATRVVGNMVHPGGLRVSPLGAAWSTDIDVHLQQWPDASHLLGAGWTSLDELHARLEIPERDRWAVLDEGRVVGAVDLHATPPPDPLDVVLRRCQRRGEVRLREVLELRELLRTRGTLPDSRVVRSAAALEAMFGGTLLSAWHATRNAVSRPAVRRWRRRLGRCRSFVRPRLRIAVSGVDGAGKSTLVSRLAEDLHRAGVPVAVVWTRPGLRLDALEPVVQLAKRLLRQEATPAVARVARGAVPSPIPSRRGIVGWLWAMVVVLVFLADVRRRDLRSRGVVLYDRHLLDALATLEVLYGSVDLRLHLALVRKFLPRVDQTFLLDVPPDVAAGRKPGDLIGLEAVQRQLEVYQRERARCQRLEVLDGRAGDNLEQVRTAVFGAYPWKAAITRQLRAH